MISEVGGGGGEGGDLNLSPSSSDSLVSSASVGSINSAQFNLILQAVVSYCYESCQIKDLVRGHSSVPSVVNSIAKIPKRSSANGIRTQESQDYSVISPHLIILMLYSTQN